MLQPSLTSSHNDRASKSKVFVDITNTMASTSMKNPVEKLTTMGSIGDNDEENVKNQQSLMKELWNEATSTTELPQPHANQNLHHRRNTHHSSSNVRDDNAPETSRGRKQHGKHRYGSRGEKIAKRVWLAAIAAFICSILIAFLMAVSRALLGDSRQGVVSSSGLVANTNDLSRLAPEDQTAAMSLSEAHSYHLKPVTKGSIDSQYFTIRMNTWHRNEQLILSVNHHATCEGVKEIQVVWCDEENEPPDEIVHHKSGKVKIERHTINSLNERFKILIDPPTLGILSLDDDVLRPCIALDAAFIRWVRHPSRMVGFDVRSHVVETDEAGIHWKYGYMSTTEKSNQYSLTLPRASFLHRDYLDMYSLALPRPMYAYVAQHFECEDVAMSFLVSSLTKGRPPLIADQWAVKSMVKLYSEEKISGGVDHKERRDKCVNDFAEMLGLKGPSENEGAMVDGVQVAPLKKARIGQNDPFFKYGAEPEDWSNMDPLSFSNPRLQDVVQTMHELTEATNQEKSEWLADQRAEVMVESYRKGMIEKTTPWKERWGAPANGAPSSENNADETSEVE